MNIKILYKPKQFVHRLIWFVEFKSLQRNLFFGKQIETLKLMKDKHIGKRCFIIGNGPSLAKTDLSKLENEFTFGLNRIYLLFDELRFSTSYYVCVNRLILTQFGDEIETKVNSPKFTFWENYDLAKNISNMNFVYHHNVAGFYPEITRGIWGGSTVTYAAMQIAFFMGFQRVILIGIDHSFSTLGKSNQTVVSEGDDPNHFAPNYFGKGVKWQLPDLKTSEYAYSLANKAYQNFGRTIQDATIDGKLNVFPKINYDSLWG